MAPERFRVAGVVSRSRDRVRRRAGVPHAGRAAAGRAAGLRDRLRAVGGHARRDPRARRARPARAGRDAARAGPRRPARAVGGRRRSRARAGRRAVPADARARGAAGGRARRRDRRADVGPGVEHAPLPRGLDDPRAARRALRAGHGDRARRSPRRSPTRSRSDGWTRRRRAAPEADDAGDARLRRGGHGPLRLHRQPVVEPAARAADRRARKRPASWSTTRSCGSPIRTRRSSRT